MIKRILACVLIVGLLTGCAGADYGEYTESIDTTNSKNSEMITSYLNKRSTTDQAIMENMLQGGTPEQRASNQMALMMYGLLQQQNDQKILTTYAPHYAIKPTTGGDVGMAVVNNLLPTLIRVGAGAYLGGEIVKGLQTTSTVVGAGASVNSGTGDIINNTDSVSGGGSYYPPAVEGEGMEGVSESPSPSPSPVVEGEATL